MIEVPPELRVVLEAAQARGAVGPGSIDAAVAHALGFLASLELELPPRAHGVDLGSGGGLPGLPLALWHPEMTWVLLDAWERRVEALRVAIEALGLKDRVRAVHARAEDFGRGPARGTADVVVSRGFGPPATTAECAAPLLRVGGWLVASTSPTGAEWPEAVSELDLGPARRWQAGGGSFVAYRLEGEVAGRFPRRPAAQERSPLF